MEILATFPHASSIVEILCNEAKVPIIYRRTFDPKKITNEITMYNNFLQQKIGHPLLCPFNTYKDIKGNIVIERPYITGSPLDEVVLTGKLDINTIHTIARKISEVTAYLHSLNICVNTLKSSNIIIDRSNNPHLVDFTFEDIMKDELKKKASYETMILVSPEGFDHRVLPSEKRDVWLLGNLLYKLYFGVTPFEEKNLIKLVNKIKNKDIDEIKAADSKLKDLILESFNPNPQTRPAASELYEVIITSPPLESSKSLIFNKSFAPKNTAIYLSTAISQNQKLAKFFSTANVSRFQAAQTTLLK